MRFRISIYFILPLVVLMLATSSGCAGMGAVYEGVVELAAHTIFISADLLAKDSYDSDPYGPLQGPVKKGLTFKEAAPTVYPPFLGELKVLNRDPNVEVILIGWVYIKEKTTRYELLEMMAIRAANKGADTIVLFREEPETVKGGYLYWSARAIKTQHENIKRGK